MSSGRPADGLASGAALDGAQLKDEDRNGARTLDDLVKRVGTDPLVVRAWAPGAGRESAPGTHAGSHALVKAWVESGAACPVR